MQDDGDGIVILAVCLVCDCTYLKCSIIGWPVNAPSLPVTRSIIGLGCLPWNAILRSPR